LRPWCESNVPVEIIHVFHFSEIFTGACTPNAIDKSVPRAKIAGSPVKFGEGRIISPRLLLPLALHNPSRITFTSKSVSVRGGHCG